MEWPRQAVFRLQARVAHPNKWRQFERSRPRRFPCDRLFTAERGGAAASGFLEPDRTATLTLPRYTAEQTGFVQRHARAQVSGSALGDAKGERANEQINATAIQATSLLKRADDLGGTRWPGQTWSIATDRGFSICVWNPLQRDMRVLRISPERQGRLVAAATKG
jgi:hypothetical protein